MTVCFGPSGRFEVWMAARSGWRLRRLNRFGPPPHGFVLRFWRFGFVVWYRLSPDDRARTVIRRG